MDHVQILLGDFSADKAVGEGAAQAAGQEEHQHGTQQDRREGEEKGGPGAEEHPARGGAQVAGDGGQNDREHLDEEKAQVGVGREAADIFLEGLGGAEGH